MSILRVSNVQNLKNNKINFDNRKKDLENEKKAKELTLKKERNSKYKDWYQLNRKHSNKLIDLAINNPKANALLYFLLDNMDGYNAVQCSSVVLQEALGMSRTTSYRHLKFLADEGFIAILKSGTANIYVVNDDLAWSSWSNNKKYCKFPTNVILSKSENEVYLKKIKSKKTKELEIKKGL